MGLGLGCLLLCCFCWGSFRFIRGLVLVWVALRLLGWLDGSIIDK